MRRFGVYVITERRCNSSKTVEHEGTLEQLIRELLVPMVKKTNSIYVGWRRTRPLDPKKVTNLNKLCRTLNTASDILTETYKLSTKYYTYKRKK